MQEFRVYTRKMARYLVEQGCVVLRQVPDVKVQGYYNWIFEDTPQLRSAVTQYSLMKR